MQGNSLFYFRLKSDHQPCGLLPLENARITLETLDAPLLPSKPRRPFRKYIITVQIGPELSKKVKRPSLLLAPESSEEQVRQLQHPFSVLCEECAICDLS